MQLLSLTTNILKLKHILKLKDQQLVRNLGSDHKPLNGSAKLFISYFLQLLLYSTLHPLLHLLSSVAVFSQRAYEMWSVSLDQLETDWKMDTKRVQLGEFATIAAKYDFILGEF